MTILEQITEEDEQKALIWWRTEIAHDGQAPPPCAIDECDKPAFWFIGGSASGEGIYCRGHFNRMQN